MGKTVAKVIGVVAFVASFFIPGGVFISGGLLGSTYFAVSFATILQGVAAISASIGFAPEFDAGDAGRQLAENLHITSSPVAVRSVAFGRVGIAGQVLFRKNIENSGDTPDELVIVLGLTGYPATSMEKFWFNGELVFDGEVTGTSAPGLITTGKFANELWVHFRSGNETSNAFPEIDSVAPEWAAKQRKLLGTSAIALRLKVTEKVEGRLEPLAQIKGAKLYDPRLDSSVPGGSGTHDFDNPVTWEWSENPKLAELLYLRGGDINGVRIFGMGRVKDAIDLENFASEANICEEQIAVVGGGTIDRYTCNGLLIPNREHRQNLRQLLSASAGTMDGSTGIYRTFAGAWRAPAMTLTEADIDGAPTEIRLQKSPDEEINVINGSFADPVDRWQVKSYPERRDQASIDQIGENAIPLDLPFTVDHRAAQRIAKIEMFRRNAARAFGANYWLRTLPLQPGDNVTQTYSRYAMNSETFRVNVWGLEAADDAEGNRRLIIPMQLTEERQEWFDWDEATEEEQTTSITSLPTMDRNPNPITIPGVAIAFEGPVPPANPQVGWLWRDTDTNIVFRWDGSAWVDYATETKTADQVDYLSGASVDSLEPSESGADATAPRVLGNGIINGSFEAGDTGWEKTADWSIVNDPANARHGSWVAELTNGGASQQVQSSRIQVSPGDRVLAQAHCKRTAGTGEIGVRIEWSDDSDTLISTSIGNGVTSSTYELSRVIAVAPASAVTAQMWIRQEGATGTSGFGDGAYMQIIPRGSDIILDDATGAVSTGQIDLNAATETLFSNVAGPVVESHTGGIPSAADIETVTAAIDNSTDAVAVVISGNMLVEQTAGGSPFDKVILGAALDSGLEIADSFTTEEEGTFNFALVGSFSGISIASHDFGLRLGIFPGGSGITVETTFTDINVFVGIYKR